MAYITHLSPGVPVTLVQNTVYALPVRKANVYSDSVLEVSNVTNSGFVAVAATTTGTTLAALYVRCTSGNAIVTVKFD
jgi:hypothetical protein